MYFYIPQLGSAAVFESSQTYYPSTVYDPDNNKVIIAYSDYGNTDSGVAIVGTVSGTSISFGSPVTFESGSTIVSSRDIVTVYDPNNQKVVIAYIDGGDQQNGKVIVGQVSGNSISFPSSPVTFNNTNTSWPSIVYDLNNQKVVIAYGNQGNGWYGHAVVGTVSGTTVTLGTPVVFESGYTTRSKAVYDPDTQKVVIAYQDNGNSNYGTAIVGTVSGTSISFGSPVVFESAHIMENSIAYDSTNQKVVIAYNDYGNSGYGTAIVGTVSGTSISFGNPVVYNSANTNYNWAIYEPGIQKVVIAYADGGNGYYGNLIVGTVSGNGISFGSPTVFDTRSEYMTTVYDPDTQKIVIAYKDHANSQYGTAIVFSPVTMGTNLTSENYIGISDGSYSNGQTATVQLIGSVDDAQSSLTPGQKYYVQDDGTLAESGSVFAGTAVSSTSLVVKS